MGSNRINNDVIGLIQRINKDIGPKELRLYNINYFNNPKDIKKALNSPKLNS